MPPTFETIGKIDFFSGIDRKLLKKLAERAIVCTYKKGEVIVREGEMCLGMYVIMRGRVEITKDRDGGLVRLAELGANQFFAEMSLIDEKPRTATVTTMEETECLLFTRDSFVTLMGKNPELAIRLARSLAERLRKTDDARPSSALAAPSAPVTMKETLQAKLLGVFQGLYTAKALT